MGKGGQEAGVHFLLIIPEFKQTAGEPVCLFLFLILLQCQCFSKQITRQACYQMTVGQWMTT